MKAFSVLTTLALMVIPGAIGQHYFAYGAPAEQQQQQVGQAHTGPTQPTKDRSIYARRASGISGVVSDVYEVFVGPSNYTYTKSAIVVLQPGGNSNVRGVINLFQENAGLPVRITGQISGLAPGNHGFHVHQSGSLTEGCKSMGGHFNPFMQPHGSPVDDRRHAGDLGNIVAGPDGVANFNLEDPRISLSGTTNIIGRGIVVHEKEDDLGRGGDEGSLKTGNAGGRVACGVIALA